MSEVDIRFAKHQVAGHDVENFCCDEMFMKNYWCKTIHDDHMRFQKQEPICSNQVAYTRRRSRELKIGTKVRMVNCLEAEKYGDRIWITESEPWRIACGEWLVLLEGYRGGFAVKFLEVVKE